MFGPAPEALSNEWFRLGPVWAQPTGAVDRLGIRSLTGIRSDRTPALGVGCALPHDKGHTTEPVVARLARCRSGYEPV